MKIKKITLLCFVQISLIAALSLVMNSCCSGGERICCSETGGINLDFSSLPGGNLVMFTVDRVVGIRIYDEIKREGSSLRCLGSREIAPGIRKDAAVVLMFCRLSCNVCVISAEVHGHGPEARIAATQRDGTTQTAVCRDRRLLTLHATQDNPFIYVILSGQEAEWLSFKLE